MNKKDIDNKLPIYKLTDKEKVLEYYDTWTKNEKYNQDMIDWNYVAPNLTIELIDNFLDDYNCNILDAGCGSGLVGIELNKRGYKNLHGVDYSKSMLDLIPENIYNTLELIDLNLPLKYKNNHFDCVVCVGTFTYGHVKAYALNEFQRIIKKDGYLCFTVNEGIYLKYNFDKQIQELSNNKICEIIEISKKPYIVNKKVEAWLCLLKKLN